MIMEEVLLLGASGSIGTQSLDVLEKYPSRFCLKGISIGHQIDKIPAILKRFPSISHVCVQEEKDYAALKEQYPSLTWHFGDDGLVSIIEECPCQKVVNSLVGFAGLVPSLTALNQDKILCLANKESLVVGGELIQKALDSGKGKLYPIDSEHVAIAKLLSYIEPDQLSKVLITASGGSLRGKCRCELRNVTPKRALSHPTWSMGAKITIDSATMMNKGFEVIEAIRLFHLPLEQIEILMHDESWVHSLVLLKDGSYLADVSKPDMRGPIEYALLNGEVDFTPVKVMRLGELEPYHFHKFDSKRYLAPGIALEAYRKGGTCTATLNAANEEAVYAFLAGKIAFLDIDTIVRSAINSMPITQNPSLRQIRSADAYARLFVQKKIERRGAWRY